MTIGKKNAADILGKIGRLFTTSEAVALGISKPTLGRLAKDGTIERLAHGIFIHQDSERPETLEFCVACMSLGPDVLIGGLTALSYYAITEQVPRKTWLMIPNSMHGRYDRFRVLRTRHSPRIEVIDHDYWRIASIERAIIEAFVYATKIGYKTALVAARTALAEGKTSEQALAKAAKKLGEWPIMAKHWEAITAK